MARHVPRNPFMRKLPILLVAFAINQVASAQLVSVGAKGGVPFLDAAQRNDESRPYLVGPSIEFRLPAGFALEVDALYQRIGNSAFFSFSESVISAPLQTVSVFHDRLRGNSWEFPVLGKYYFRSRNANWQPYIATGWSLRTIGLHEAISGIIVGSDGTAHPNNFHVDSRSDLGVGAVVAAGLRYRVGRLALLPEVRYTRWGSSSSFSIRKNEAAFLLGISF